MCNNSTHYSAKFRWACKNIPFFMKIYRSYNFFNRELRFKKTSSYINGMYNENYYKLKSTVEMVMRKTINDPELEKKLIPKHEFPDKRPGFSPTHWYLKAFKKDNVDLYTGEGNGIDKFTKTGILLKNGTHVELDTVILATGYDVLGSTVNPFETIGRNGTKLVDHWKELPTALYGCTTDKFPNFFKLYGPNTSGSVLQTPIFWIIECCVNYSVNCIKHVCDGGQKEIEVKSDVVKSYNEWLQDKFSKIFLCKNVKSYYLNDRNENFMLFCDCGTKFWWLSLICDRKHYKIR